MKSIVWILAVSLSLLASSEKATAAPKVSSLSWLAGCWQGGTGEKVIEEHWMAPRGGTMLGMGRTTAGDRTIEYEHLSIEEQDERLVYEAMPSGQLPASFPSTKVTSSSVVFENLEHDFPQRILYSLAEDGSLRARIEGTRDGKLQGIDYPMKRVPCPGGAR